MVKEYVLFGLGNPLLDIQVRDNGFLKKYGLKPNDSILSEEKHMMIYQEISELSDAQYIAGGSAQNTLRGAQYVLPENSTVYVGCVGKDQFAEHLKSVSKQEGLRAEYLVDATTPTGVCAVILSGKDRSLATRLAAASNYNIAHLKSPRIWALVENADYYYVESYQFSSCILSVISLSEEAAMKNKLFIMNLSAEYLCHVYKDVMDTLSQYWDCLIGNETEAIAFAEAHGLKTKDTIEIALYIARLPKKNTRRPRIVVITQGSRDVVFVESFNGRIVINQTPVPTIPDDQIVDTNAAGDAFAGGFVAGLILGYSLEKSVRCGIWLAQLCIRQSGSTYPFPKQVFHDQDD
ncbi:hypothetical protein T552_01518 [Pneumocystis carinii B80]|uniref:Adenosine kinase n=1 Tax=Pneumocystis carinii (strain B80) TaxID=1408658 RepID=A0A0W4ZKI7_PNEC8|nr:hypothetical protein T552_01518 [Pneumocystis carinii B80]KTW28889.1 hypothetical protein T552_01518 [Pneumocystis carinii B80]